MYTDVATIAVRLPLCEVLRDQDRYHASLLGISPMIYAAIAYFVFDDSFFAEDVIENNPSIMHEFMDWLEFIYSTHTDLITNLRTFYDMSSKDPIPGLPYALLRVRYESSTEDLYVTATSGDHARELGNQWRFLAHCR